MKSSLEKLKTFSNLKKKIRDEFHILSVSPREFSATLQTCCNIRSNDSSFKRLFTSLYLFLVIYCFCFIKLLQHCATLPHNKPNKSTNGVRTV